MRARPNPESGGFSHYATVKAKGLPQPSRLENGLKFSGLHIFQWINSWRPCCPGSIPMQKSGQSAFSLLFIMTSGDWFETTSETGPGRYHGRHLLMYATVFWPWHTSRCNGAKDCQTLTVPCVAFISVQYHRMWVRYKTTDSFWHGGLTSRNEGNELHSTVSVFGLREKFRTLFESKLALEKSHMDHYFDTCANLETWILT